jgi:SHS2 domain-containing protein
MTRGTHRIVGRGSDLGIEVAGPDLDACLQAAAEGFAAALTDLPVDAPTRRETVAFDEDSPEGLLVALIDDCVLRLDADGELVVGLDVDEAEGGRLRGHLVVCDLDAVTVHGVAPKAATWHGVRLGPDDGGWSGRVMIDL